MAVSSLIKPLQSLLETQAWNTATQFQAWAFQRKNETKQNKNNNNNKTV